MTFRIKTFTLFAALACVAPVHAANMVANGDFSANADDFTQFPGYINQPNNANFVQDWNFVNGPGNTGTSVGINGDGLPFSQPFGPADNSGVDNFLFIQNGANQSGFKAFTQVLDLSPNATYDISFAAAVRNNGNGGLGRVQIGDATTVYYTSGNQNWGSAAFTTFNDSFSTGASFNGPVTIQLYGFANGRDTAVAYSNISVTPSPTAALFGAIGLGGLLCRRRRAS